MKKISVIILFLLSFCTHAQYGFRILHIRPTGEMGEILKPAVSLGLISKSFDTDTKWQLRSEAGFIKFKTRLDSFPKYEIDENSGSTKVQPGWLVISKFNIFYFSLGADRKIKINEELKIYPGIDFGILYTSTAYRSNLTYVNFNDFYGNYAYVGTKFRFGIEYLYDEKIGFFAEAARSYNYSFTILSGFTYNDYSIGVRFNLNQF